MAHPDSQTIDLTIRRRLDGAPRIVLTAVFPTREAFDVQLPTWRPGRYELGQFAQYVYAMEGQTADGTWIALRKTSLHTWHVPAETAAVRWVFHADTFNAGSTGVADDVLYINPVNCFLYHPDHQDWGYSIALEMYPSSGRWRRACLRKRKTNARDVQHAMDSPILAGPTCGTAPTRRTAFPFTSGCTGRPPGRAAVCEEHQDFTDAQIAHFRLSRAALPFPLRAA